MIKKTILFAVITILVLTGALFLVFNTSDQAAAKAGFRDEPIECYWECVEYDFDGNCVTEVERCWGLTGEVRMGGVNVR